MILKRVTLPDDSSYINNIYYCGHSDTLRLGDTASNIVNSIYIYIVIYYT